MKGKDRVFWIVVDDQGLFANWTLEISKAYAIRALLTNPIGELAGRTWKQLYRQGWRVRKVRIEPVGWRFD